VPVPGIAYAAADAGAGGYVESALEVAEVEGEDVDSSQSIVESEACPRHGAHLGKRLERERSQKLRETGK
jgi:hypothetical protein